MLIGALSQEEMQAGESQKWHFLLGRGDFLTAFPRVATRAGFV